MVTKILRRLVTRRSTVRRTAVAPAVVLLLIGAACPPTPTPGTPAGFSTACFVPATGVPYRSGPPTVDGVVAGDLGWTQSFRYTADNASSVPDVVIQGIRDDASNSLYLSFEVNNDQSFDDRDAIVLGFSPRGAGTPGDDRLIVIYPMFANVGAGVGGAPRMVKYWTNSADWKTNGNSTAVVDPAWLKNNIRATSQSSSPTTRNWYVELRIPITTTASTSAATDTGIDLPMGTSFGLWADVIRLTAGTPTTGVEFTWPQDLGVTSTPNSGSLTPYAGAPLVAAWGSGLRGPATSCNGVTFAESDIKVTHPAPSALGPTEISTLGPNTFSVDVGTDAVNSAGTYINSSQVRATFKIANWGIPAASEWSQIVVGDNPTPYGDIPAASGSPAVYNTRSLSTQPWTVPSADTAKYAASLHQCVLVELESNIPGVIIKQKSLTRNMDFVTTHSPFVDTATISTRGYRPAPGTRSVEMYLGEFTYNVPPEMRWESQLNGVERVGPSRYMLRGNQESSSRVVASVLPPAIDLPTRDFDLRASGGTGRGGLAVPVRGGDIVTVLTEGSIRLRGDDRSSVAGPDGMALRGVDGGDFPLGKEQSPAGRIGGVIGRFNNARSMAPMYFGHGTTMRVPPKADTLYLDVNDTPEGARQHVGSYRVEVVETPLEKYHTFSNSLLLRDAQYEPIRLTTGANLPTWIVCGATRTGRSVDLEGEQVELLNQRGCFGSVVRRMSAQR